MPNPIITNSDTSELEMFNGTFADRSVTVPASTTLLKGTALGYNTTTSKTVGSESDGTDGEDATRFLLMQDLVNDTVSAVDSSARVMISGEVDGSKILFLNGTDTLDTDIVSGLTVRDSMKTEGLIAVFRTTEDILDNQ